MDGKKKKNRKKKGNQNRVTDEIVSASNVEEVLVPESDHGSVVSEQSHHGQAPGNSDVQSVGVSESDIEPERQKIYEAICTKLRVEVRQLEDEKSLWLQKEDSLEEKIRFLQSGIESCVQKEVILEEKLKDLQTGYDSSMQKQVILENKVKHIEGIGDSWNQTEMSIREMISRLDAINEGLQLQVMELKESRESLLLENQQLKESISALESRMQRLETDAFLNKSSTIKITEFPEEKNLLHQLEAGHEPLNKLSAEKAILEKAAHELLNEKVNDVHTEPDDPHAVAIEPDPAELHYAISPFGGSTPGDYGEKILPLERIHDAITIKNSTVNFGADTRVRQGQMPELDESRISVDVVSVSLDGVQVQDDDSQAMKSDENAEPVPMSDAPLIGAPFRLISYFAKYVSGADLVNESRSKLGR